MDPRVQNKFSVFDLEYHIPPRAYGGGADRGQTIAVIPTWFIASRQAVSHRQLS